MVIMIVGNQMEDMKLIQENSLAILLPLRL